MEQMYKIVQCNNIIINKNKEIEIEIEIDNIDRNK